MRHVRSLSQTPSSQTVRCFYDPTVYFRAARGWKMINCDIRSAGSIASLVSRDSRVSFRHCSLGGALERKYRPEFDELYCASEALTVLGEARVTVHNCRFEDTWGPGCSLMGSSVAHVSRSLFLRTAIGTVFDWDCRCVRGGGGGRRECLREK